MNTPLYFIPLGGCGEIGMNASFYGDGQEWIMLDCGITFSRKPDGIFLPDLTFFLPRIKKLHGLILTHAHEDHYGAVVHLWKYLKCPVYATPFTAELLRHKLKEAQINLPLTEIPLGGHFQVGPFSARFISLTHSIPEPNAVVLEKDGHTIFHTGDWKIDPVPLIGRAMDIPALIELGKKGVTAMVCDSTNVFEEGHSGSEEAVQEQLIKTVSDYPEAAVIISCFASNVARMASCYTAAKENGRQVVLAGRSLLRMEEAARHCGYFDQSITFLSPEQVRNVPRSKLLVITTGSQAEPRAALSTMARKAHPFIKLKENDAVIFSSRIIPGNEEAIFALQNQLTRMGIRIVNYKDCDDLHVSGHPHREELREMYSWLKPQIAVPVHGEDRHIYQHAAVALEWGVPQAIRPHNGQLFRLAPGPAELIETLPAGRLFVDGKRLIEAKGKIMKERRDLLESGIIYVSLVLSRELRKIIDRFIVFHGFCRDDEEEGSLTDIVVGAVRQALPKKITMAEIANLEDLLIKNIRFVIKEKLDKKPVVKVQLVWT